MVRGRKNKRSRTRAIALSWPSGTACGLLLGSGRRRSSFQHWGGRGSRAAPIARTTVNRYKLGHTNPRTSTCKAKKVAKAGHLRLSKRLNQWCGSSQRRWQPTNQKLTHLVGNKHHVGFWLDAVVLEILPRKRYRHTHEWRNCKMVGSN